jgi:hypothetical protein
MKINEETGEITDFSADRDLEELRILTWEHGTQSHWIRLDIGSFYEFLKAQTIVHDLRITFSRILKY